MRQKSLRVGREVLAAVRGVEAFREDYQVGS